MKIQTLKKLKDLKFYEYLVELSNGGIHIPNDERLEEASNDKIAVLLMYGTITMFFIDKHNLLGNVYSNASGYLYEVNDAIGGTNRIISDYDGDDESSGAFTTYQLAFDKMVDMMIDYINNITNANTSKN